MQNLIACFKVWKVRDERDERNDKYEKKAYYFNPELPFEGLEACRASFDGRQVECTKIHYPGKFLMILGSPEEFLENCRKGNVAAFILQDLYKEGITIKQFMEQNERINGIAL
jgi:hypothetical protein